MENRTLARRYAKVLLGIDPSGELEDSVYQLNTAIHQTRHVLMVFLDPLVAGQTKLDAIHKALGIDLPEQLSQFLDFVNRKGRLDHLPLILSMYLQARQHDHGSVHGQIRSATALSADQIAHLEHTMGQHLGRQCVLSNVIDARLIGGFSIHIGDTVFDNSVRGQIERLRTHFTALAG